MEETNILILPEEVQHHIFSFLPTQNLARMSLVCKSWAQDTEAVFEQKIKEEIGPNPKILLQQTKDKTNRRNLTYRELYGRLLKETQIIKNTEIKTLEELKERLTSWSCSEYHLRAILKPWDVNAKRILLFPHLGHGWPDQKIPNKIAREILSDYYCFVGIISGSKYHLKKLQSFSPKYAEKAQEKYNDMNTFKENGVWIIKKRSNPYFQAELKIYDEKQLEAEKRREELQKYKREEASQNNRSFCRLL